MTRNTALATGLTAIALGGLGAVGIAGAQPPADDATSPGARGGQHQTPGEMGRPHRQMADHHREMMRDPQMRALMRSPDMRTMHRDMMRMHREMDMPATGMGMMD
jgi:hypothetical protein